MESLILKPIDTPKGIFLKILYWYSKISFGKVIAPIKIIYSRAPKLIAVAQSLEKAEKSLSLSSKLVSLIKAFVSPKNECAFCNDIAIAMAVKKKIGKDLFKDLEFFSESPHYLESEKIALQYISEILENKRASDSTIEKMKLHFNEKEIVEITWVYAMEVYYNSMGKPFGLTSDGLS
ncbi:MAG TPA: hypothetical protein PK079_05755 [Leptospiraceae bacterium]|nr:hypothetical protein [Leptospiraceae bacterium]HMW05001.1 hypothetical protein [Leptospiraceae bacterium]HMX31445.1 hypothetical protein [Leptospiraceae bacterium]HMY33555.1 hypothetical protein [Leptospiraceae bacterium]HMZ66999.1 hypothetical protein [Leptospiraceae bacterium]